MPKAIARVDVTPGSTGWQDVDITSHVGGDAGSIGLARVRIVNSGSVARTFGIRKGGSTDTLTGTANNNSHTWLSIGVDGNDIFQVNFDNVTDLQAWLEGYATTAEAGNVANGVDKSVGSTGSFVDQDISGDTGGDTATQACYLIKNNNASSRVYAFRRNGSTDSRVSAGIGGGYLHGGCIAVDGNEINEMQIAHLDVDAFLVGWLTANFTAITNGIDHSATTTGAYEDIDVSADIGGDDTIVYGEATPETNAFDQFAFRKNGDTYDTYHDLTRQGFMFVEVDGSGIFETQVQLSRDNWYLLGSSQEAAAAGANPKGPLGLPLYGALRGPI